MPWRKSLRRHAALTSALLIGFEPMVMHGLYRCLYPRSRPRAVVDAPEADEH
jgi:hypothetical protein